MTEMQRFFSCRYILPAHQGYHEKKYDSKSWILYLRLSDRTAFDI